LRPAQCPVDACPEAGAEAAPGAAVAGFERLVADVPGNPHYGGELAEAQGNLADLLADRRAFAAAVGWLKRAAPRIEAALKANPDRSSYRDLGRSNRRTLARCRAGLGELTAGVEIVGSISRLGLDPAADTYQTACALAQCVPSAGRDDPLRSADRAMATLCRAIAAGFHDPARIQTDPGLDSLRDRDDFRLPMMDLAMAAEPFARVE
jgi:hypothetical protein